jgi:hypothetical protein
VAAGRCLRRRPRHSAGSSSWSRCCPFSPSDVRKDNPAVKCHHRAERSVWVAFNLASDASA